MRLCDGCNGIGRVRAVYSRVVVLPLFYAIVAIGRGGKNDAFTLRYRRIGGDCNAVHCGCKRTACAASKIDGMGGVAAAARGFIDRHKLRIVGDIEIAK